MPQQALYNTHSLQFFTPVFLLPEDYSTRIQEFLLFLQKLNVDAAASLPHGDYLWISHTWIDKEIQRKELLKTNIYYVHGEIYFTWAVRSYPARTACISESSLV